MKTEKPNRSLNVDYVGLDHYDNPVRIGDKVSFLDPFKPPFRCCFVHGRVTSFISHCSDSGLDFCLRVLRFFFSSSFLSACHLCSLSLS